MPQTINARNLLNQHIEEVCLAEQSQICNYCMSQMSVLSADLEIAFLSLTVEGTNAEDDLDIQTQEIVL